MRDLFLTIIVFGVLPLILKFPHLGILVWTWMSYMLPHSQTYGFAISFNFMDYVAIACMLAVLMTKERKSLPKHPVVFLLFLYVFWFHISSLLSGDLELVQRKYVMMMKILLFTFMTMMVMQSKSRIQYLVMVIMISLSYYGFKGGIFTIIGGGQNRVWGPPLGFFGDNNHFAMVMLMILPLTRFWYLNHPNLYVRLAFIAMGFCILFAIFGTQSRGALVGLTCMSIFFAIKTKKIGSFIVLLPFLVMIGLVFMPDSWRERMQTMESYEEDDSAMTRLRMWGFAMDIANHNPVFGGGFDAFFNDKQVKKHSAGVEGPLRAVHSLHFEVIGEQGWMGYMIFLLLAFTTYATGNAIIAHARGRPDLKWASDMAMMLQVGMVGYASAGAFVNVATFDLYYHYIAIMVLLRLEVQKALDKEKLEEKTFLQSAVRL